VMRSIDTRMPRGDFAVSVGDEAIAVGSYNRGLAVFNLHGAVYGIEVPGGVGYILARAGTNDFVVTPNNWSGNQPPTDLLISSDGTVTDIVNGPLRDYGIWSVRYLAATGEAVVNDSGGTYAIDASGAARRLSTGDLVAVGRNHVLVRECDEVLTCVSTRVDAVSGERVPLSAPELDVYRGFDPNLSLSPDGSMMTYVDWMSTPSERRLIDLVAGTSVVLDPIGQNYIGDNAAAWAADSSGIFMIEDYGLVFYDRATGERVEVAPGVDLGSIVAVAARPLTSEISG
jgi:hypothetical protein